MSYSREKELYKIKNFDLVLFIQSLGYDPKRSSKDKVWFCSPLTATDTNASFCVFTDKNRFKCFSSNTGGSIIDFVMAFFNIPYDEALKLLREKIYHK